MYQPKKLKNRVSWPRYQLKNHAVYGCLKDGSVTGMVPSVNCVSICRGVLRVVMPPPYVDVTWKTSYPGPKVGS